MNLEENKNRFLRICTDEIIREGLGDLLKWLDTTDFYYAPASRRFHGNHEGGLVEHSLNVYDSLKKIIEINNIQSITKDSIAVVSLFHDICKINYYKKTWRNKKDDAGLWTKVECYEINDIFPFGHGEKSCVLLREFIKLTKDELLAIRYHMGGFDISVKGGDYSISKAYDMCILAPLLQIADMNATYICERSYNE